MGHDVVSRDYLQGYRREGICEMLIRSQLLQEDENKDIRSNQRIVNNRSDGSVGVVVVERKNHWTKLPRVGADHVTTR